MKTNISASIDALLTYFFLFKSSEECAVYGIVPLILDAKSLIIFQLHQNPQEYYWLLDSLRRNRLTLRPPEAEKETRFATFQK